MSEALPSDIEISLDRLGRLRARENLGPRKRAKYLKSTHQMRRERNDRSEVRNL
jgi:hypothetical protein